MTRQPSPPAAHGAACFATIVVCTAACAALGGCESSAAPSRSETPPPHEIAPMEQSDVDSALLADIAARLPEHWTGTGTLEARAQPPAGAPAWAGAVAEIVDDEGERFLRATGMVDRVNNPALARSTATARARAVLATWIGTQRLLGSEVVEHWAIPRGPTLTLVRVVVPEQWQPGEPLQAEPAGAEQMERSP